MNNKIDQLLDKYWEGETSVEEHAVLMQYFLGKEIHQAHQPFKDLFIGIASIQQIQSPVITDIDTLLDKYWEGTTTQKEEQIIKSYFKSGQISETHQSYADLFDFFEEQLETTYVAPIISLSENANNQVGAQQNTIKKMTSWMVSVAAIAVFAVGALFVIKNMNASQTEDTLAAQVYEVEDPEEALRITREALALVSNKFKESQEPLKDNLEKIEKINIFKTE